MPSNMLRTGLSAIAATILAIVRTSYADTVVFKHGEGGYPCIRIPSIIKTSTSLLAFAGTRCGSGDGCYLSSGIEDIDHQDLVMKRSTDNGKTWSPLKVVYSVKDCDVRDHGTPVFHSGKNRVVVVTRGEGKNTWVTSSDDDGATWTKAVPVPLGKYNTSRPSPGRGLQLNKTNPYAPNRLVFVAQLGAGNSADKGNVIYYSDDAGISWNVSPTIVPGAQEAQIAELSNGSLLMNARVGLKASKDYHRQFSMSHDGGATWGDIVYRYDFRSASCFGSTIAKNHQGARTLYYSHPAGLTRVNGKVWVSEDEGKSFKQWFSVSADRNAKFAYSCLTETMKGDTIGFLYECETPSGVKKDGCKGASCYIVYRTFSAVVPSV